MHVCLNGEDLGVAASNIPKVLMNFYLFILNTLEMQYSTPTPLRKKLTFPNKAASVNAN